MLLDENDLTSCSLSYVFSVIDGKWKPFIIWYLYKAPEGFCRYGELKRHIPWKISNKMFTQQLKELEDANIIMRTEYDEKPLRVEYRLTEPGKLLAPAILYLRDWGAAFGKRWTEEDLLERTLGVYRDGTLHYGHKSEELNGSVEISFHYKFGVRCNRKFCRHCRAKKLWNQNNTNNRKEDISAHRQNLSAGSCSGTL